MGKLIDLSHTIEEGLITYKGLPAPIICDFLTREHSQSLYAEGTEFQISKIEMVANTGTYLDSPFHRFADGMDVSELDLRSLASLDGIVVRKPEVRAIGPNSFAGLDVKGKAVLVNTGWDKHWKTDQYFDGFPYLTGEAADALVEAGATLVGIDSMNIDNMDDLHRPVHTKLLGAGILIVEHMTGLQHIPDSGFRFSAAPVKVKGMGTFPVRAYAELQDRLECMGDDAVKVRRESAPTRRTTDSHLLRKGLRSGEPHPTGVGQRRCDRQIIGENSLNG